MSTWPGGPVRALADAVRELLDVAFDRPEAPGVLPIVQAGDPVLRTPAAPYGGQLGDELPRLLEAMRRTMRAAPGVGLAAPQIGIGLALAVCEDAGLPGDERERLPMPYRVLVNPRYVAVEDDGGVGDDSASASAPSRVAFFEGCLSVAGWQAVVARPRRIRLTGQDETGAPLDEVLTGWPARIAQHETDHLRGELYLDRAETRSLTSNENLARFWGRSPDPAPAAELLGFPLP
ncbi:peptide deformylase [Isoptericola halotolerans]|uniref:peptide deformylase n=1 Tax=Isoptericola halotolerans TaxID=300560 RepID=UPI00388FD592